MKSFSNILLLIFLICCVIATSSETLSKFSVEYEWTFVNFTWSNPRIYRNAIKTQRYIPQNVAIGGIKYYKDRIFLAMSRLCPGTPVTMGYISTNDGTSKKNRLVTPFPDWKTNDLTVDTCADKLESVQGMEIDPNGIMWVIDGHRTNPTAKCPPKLVLYDLNHDDFKVVWSFTFPEKICSTKGGYLDDIVVDGDFAYITDFSMIDPGLIVVSKKDERSWKLRDSTMFAEIRAAPFVIDGTTVTLLASIDGIALSPQSAKQKKVYYSAVTGLSLYSISTTILKNESLCSLSEWRYNVTYVGEKQAQSDGMMMDNNGNLYYGLIPSYGVGKWDTHKPFSSSGMIAQNRSTMIWTDCFAFDNKGYLYLLTDHIYKFVLTPGCKFSMPEEVVFRILKLYTGTKSYFY